MSIPDISKPCNTCNIPKPFTNQFYPVDKRNRSGLGGQCRECRSHKIDAWQKANMDSVLAASRRWKEDNPDKVRAYSKKYWAENKEAQYRKYREWLTSERNAYHHRLRRNRKLSAVGFYTIDQLKARIDFYGGLCYMCGASGDTIDHVIPLSKGGTNWPANLRPACRSCNSSKGSKF